MTRLVITSRVPGFRRAGIEHPARKVYEAGQLTEKQLDAIRAEPNLTVTEYTPESEAAPADGTLPSAGGGEDSLARVMRAAVLVALASGVSVDEFLAAARDEWTAWVQIPAPQLADAEGRTAEPEAEVAAPASDSAASGQAGPTSETGEVMGSGSAAATLVTDLSHQDTQPAADHAPGAPAEGAEGTAAPSANPPVTKPAKAARKAR